MAYTEQYVTVAGAGSHDGSSEGNAWTFAEMVAAAPAAGSRINIKAGAYSEGITTLPANGTISAPICLRGYNATIGDLDNQGRGADGLLNTANFPDVTLTGLWTPSAYVVLQNLDITGALSSYLIGSTTVDYWAAVNCRVVNTQNNASAGTLQGDDGCIFLNCDLSCTGANHSIVLDADSYAIVHGCRVVVTLNTSSALQVNSGSVSKSAFLGTGNTSKAIVVVTTGVPTSVIGNTAYNFGTFLALPNAAPVFLSAVVDNHVTDCAKYIDGLYAATADFAAIEMYNRTRDNTTPRTGIFSAVLAGEATTDAGGAMTDYVSATDLQLIAGAAGVAAGMMPNADCGAFQRSPIASLGATWPMMRPGRLITGI